MRIRTSLRVVGATGSLILVGCITPGPTSIMEQRPNYNEVIRETSRDQVFYNIVRVYNDDIPQFMDVTTINAAMSFQGSLAGTGGMPQMKSGGGGSRAVTVGGTSSGQTVTTTNVPVYVGHDFSLTGTVQISETPTITYQPLQGQPLVQQISTPITVDSISKLFDSNWPVAAILTMATDRLTPRSNDYYAALNAIIDLDAMNAIVITAEKSPRKGENPGQLAGVLDSQNGFRAFVQKNVLNNQNSENPTGAQAQNSSGANDLLVIHFEPDRLMSGAEGIDYSDSTRTEVQDAIETERAEKQRATELWARLQHIYMAKDPNRIELRIATPSSDSMGKRSPNPPADPTTGTDYSQFPSLRTRSALGILRAVTKRGWNTMEVMAPDEYERFVVPELKVMKKWSMDASFYRFDEEQLERYRAFRKHYNQAEIDTISETTFCIWEKGISARLTVDDRDNDYRLFTGRWAPKSQTDYFEHLVGISNGETGFGEQYSKDHLNDEKKAPAAKSATAATPETRQSGTPISLVSILEAGGFTVWTSDTVEDTNAQIKKGPDLVILDVNVRQASNVIKQIPTLIRDVWNGNGSEVLDKVRGAKGVVITPANPKSGDVFTIKSPNGDLVSFTVTDDQTPDAVVTGLAQAWNGNPVLKGMATASGKGTLNLIFYIDTAPRISAGVNVGATGTVTVKPWPQPKTILVAVDYNDSMVYRLGQQRVGDYRHFLIVIRTKEREDTNNSYVMYQYPGDDHYYYIDKNDRVTRKNFSLIDQFLTMQAVPPTQSGPTSTINVGG